MDNVLNTNGRKMFHGKKLMVKRKKEDTCTKKQGVASVKIDDDAEMVKQICNETEAVSDQHFYLGYFCTSPQFFF